MQCLVPSYWQNVFAFKLLVNTESEKNPAWEIAPYPCLSGMIYSDYPTHASIHRLLLREVALPSKMRSDGLGITVLITPHTNLPIVATCLPIKLIVNTVTYKISSKFHYLIHTYLFIQ